MYQQIVLRLNEPDYVTLGGPQHHDIIDVMKTAGPGKHLAGEDADGAFGIVVKPVWLYLDFKAAIEQADLLAMGLKPAPLERPRKGNAYPGLTAGNLRASLRAAGHPLVVRRSGDGWTNATMASPAGFPFGSTGGLQPAYTELPELDDPLAQ
jgi:hypothetical protein